MRIAIISDIHGNLEALKTALDDIKKRNIDKIFCLGDTILKGAHSEECVNLVRQNCEVSIKGNCDNLFDSKDATREWHGLSVKLQQDRIDWLKENISKENKEYLRNIPYSYEFYMSGSLIRLLHAHPAVIDKVILNEDSYDKKYEMFLPSQYTLSQNVADIVIYGHLHAPFMNKFYNKTLINVGSVGNSFNAIRNDEKDSSCMETTAINYLILTGEFGDKNYGKELSFEFVRINYDIDKELENSKEMIELDSLELELKEGRYRNMVKIYEKRD